MRSASASCATSATSTQSSSEPFLDIRSPFRLPAPESRLHDEACLRPGHDLSDDRRFRRAALPAVRGVFLAPAARNTNEKPSRGLRIREKQKFVIAPGAAPVGLRPEIPEILSRTVRRNSSVSDLARSFE